MLNKPTLLASQRLAMFLAQTLALALVEQHSTLGALPRVTLGDPPRVSSEPFGPLVGASFS